MPDAKTTPASVLTGSTGNPAVDMTPRAAWVTLWTFGPGLLAAILGADSYATAGLSTVGGAVGVLTAAAFDAIIRPRLHA